MINEWTIFVTVILVVMVFAIPRKYFLLPFITAACFIPADQRVIIFDLDFTPLRLLVVMGALRLLLRGEIRSINWNRFDKIVLLWAVVGAVIYVVQWADTRALIYKCGVLFDVFGLYWIFRQSIRTWTDISFVFKIFAVGVLVLTPFVVFELATGRNPFLVFGRVHTVVRESGRHRCQASFPHSIMLGLFWATLFPVFVGLTKAKACKKLYWAAAAASVFIVFSTASSTPIGTLASAVCLLALFPYRRFGRQIALALCGLTAALHVVMKAPVWQLIARVRIISGSTGWHRYRLIDAAINRFDEWALLGTRSTAHWGWGMQDITNQYIAQGVGGGIVTLALFVYLLIRAVRISGSYSLKPMPKDKQWLIWCICVSILAHCVSFIGIAYFGQIRMLLYLTFAIIAVIYEMSSFGGQLAYSPRLDLDFSRSSD